MGLISWLQMKRNEKQYRNNVDNYFSWLTEQSLNNINKPEFKNINNEMKRVIKEDLR